MFGIPVNGQRSNLRAFQLGGTTTAGGATNFAINRFKYPSEDIATIADVLGGDPIGQCGVQNYTDGYALGGSASTNPLSRGAIRKFPFSSETHSTLAETLDTGTRGIWGAGINSKSKGYVPGGVNSTHANIDDIQDFTFSTELASTLVATLSIGKNDSVGVSSSLVGYAMTGLSGFATSGRALESGIDRLTFSTESVGTIFATVSIPKWTAAGANSVAKGYVLGGEDSVNLGVGAGTDTIESLKFSDETTAVLVATLGTARYAQATFNFPQHCYIVGGLDTSNTRIDTIEKMSFVTETVSATALTLPAPTSDMTTVQTPGAL